MLKYKKAQIGETLTWIVATILIIVILLIFVYIATALSPLKAITMKNLRVGFEEKIDLLEIKTSLAHFLTKEKNKDAIDDWIKNENE